MNGFPYFKFSPDKWLIGKISSFDIDQQGLFLIFCMLAWIGHGKFEISVMTLAKRYRLDETWINSSVLDFEKAGIITKIDGAYEIKFIKEQIIEMLTSRKQSSIAGKASAEKRKKIAQLKEEIHIQEKRREEKSILLKSVERSFNGRSTVVEPPQFLFSLDGFSEDLWNDWMAQRKKKKASNSERAIKILTRKLEERPNQAVKAIETCIEAGWISFEWEWVENRIANGKDYTCRL